MKAHEVTCAAPFAGHRQGTRSHGPRLQFWEGWSLVEVRFVQVFVCIVRVFGSFVCVCVFLSSFRVTSTASFGNIENLVKEERPHRWTHTTKNQRRTIRTTTRIQECNLERLRFNRRGASTPLWRVESCYLPGRWPNPIPAIPPKAVKTPHLHGALRGNIFC